MKKVYILNLLFIIVFIISIFLNPFFEVYNCFHGASYMEECDVCKDRDLSYSMCSGFCYNDTKTHCGVDPNKCCYTELSLGDSAMGMTCSYKWGIYGYLKTKQSLEKWQEEMIIKNC